MLESSEHGNGASNFRTLGKVQKKLLRLKNAPKLPEPLVLSIFNLPCQL